MSEAVSDGASDISKLLQFMGIVGQLKEVKRTGWVERGVAYPESVADHMYRMAIMTMLITNKQGLDKERCLKLAVVHDLAESVVGDISPAQGVSQEEKHRREKEAMAHCESLLPKEIGSELMSLWEEYETRSSAEARFVKDLDRFEMILQAYEYEKKEDRPGDLQSFFDSTKGKFQHEEVKVWVEELYKMRNKGQDESIKS